MTNVKLIERKCSRDLGTRYDVKDFARTSPETAERQDGATVGAQEDDIRGGDEAREAVGVLWECEGVEPWNAVVGL